MANHPSRSVSAAARALGRALSTAGLDVGVTASRQSESRYLVVSSADDDDLRSYRIRVSRHPNPAARFDRVSGPGDRASEADYEVRIDLGADWRDAVAAAQAFFARPLADADRVSVALARAGS